MKVQDWVFLAMSEGRADRSAPVSPVSVPATDWAVVAISTLPATVVLAFGCVLQEETADQAPAMYIFSSPVVVL